MKLSSTQLAQLRQDLTILAVIHYKSLMNELLDHYASLTEQKMAIGLSFEEASRWAWAEMGSGVGIQQIQTDFEDSVGKRHRAILKSYFGWPTFITTFLIATLVYLITPLVSAKTMSILLDSYVFIPMLVLLYGYNRQRISQSDRWEVFRNYLVRSGKVTFYLSIYGGFLLHEFTHKPTAVWLFQLHSTVGIVSCCLSLIYSFSLLQLCKENFSLGLPKVSVQ